jgi:hypothetical protein
VVDGEQQKQADEERAHDRIVYRPPGAAAVRVTV